MSNQQWQEGKTYRFKPDMIKFFKSIYSCNERIANKLDGQVITVKNLNGGNVLGIEQYSVKDLNILYWFTASEIQYFELVNDTTEEIPMTNATNIRPVADIVVEFLEKLAFVAGNDYTVSDILYINKDGAVLTTDFADFRGGKQIYEFVTNRYDLLQQEAKHKKNNELMERKAKLEAELAEVNKELGNV